MARNGKTGPDEIIIPSETVKEMADLYLKEKMNIIKDLDSMGEDEKRVELVKKVLGIGRWAIGGSKLIYAYDQDQYEKEREERVRRGDTDMPYTQSATVPGNHEVYDMAGAGANAGANANAVDAFYEAQGGYDVAQESSDDF